MAETKAAYTHVGPGLPPLHGAQASALLLGSVPSAKRRDQAAASIRNVEPNDVAALIRRLGVQAVFCNGAASGRVYAKYAQARTGMPAVVLPSTSPANAAWSMDRLREAWGRELLPFLQQNSCASADFVL